MRSTARRGVDGEPKKGLLCHYKQGFSELFEGVKIPSSWPKKCFGQLLDFRHGRGRSPGKISGGTRKSLLFSRNVLYCQRIESFSKIKREV
jgi:hypothetical protein